MRKEGGRKGAGGDVLGLVILKLDMQAILDTDFHLDGVVRVWWHAIRVHPDITFLDDVREPSRYRHSDIVSVVVTRKMIVSITSSYPVGRERHTST